MYQKLNKFIIFVVFLVSLPGLATAETLSLDQAVSSCMQSYPNIVSAKNKLRSAESSLSYAYSFLWPALSVKGSVGDIYTDPLPDSMGGTRGLPDEIIKNKQTATSVAFPVFIPAAYPGLDIAYKRRDLALLDMQKVQMDTVFSLTQAYYQLYLTRQTVILLQSNLAEARENYNMLKVQYESQVSPKTSMLRAEIQMLQLEQNLITASKNLTISEMNFKAFVPYCDPRTVELVLATRNTTYTIPVFEVVRTQMYKTRPEWQAYLLNKKLAQASFALAQADYFPNFQVISSQTWTNNEYDKNPDTAYDQKGWNTFLSGSWTFFNGFGTDAKTSSAWYDLNSFLATESLTTKNLEVELNDAYLSLQEALLKLQTSEKLFALSRENYNQTKALAQSGVSSALELVDALNTFSSAEISLSSAQAELYISKARLSRLQGIILDQEGELNL